MSCQQVGCKLRKTSENYAVCVKNGCTFRLEKQKSVEDHGGILWFFLIAFFLVFFVSIFI